MASFSGITIKERGAGNGQGYPVWSKAGNTAIKHIAGSSKNVIQKLGTKLPRMAMPVRLTAAQLTSLYGVVGTSATLVFHFESTTATLEAIDSVEEFHHGLDAYTAVLHFIRSSGDFVAPSTSLLLESGATLLTEASSVFTLE